MSNFHVSAYLHVRTLEHGHSDTVNCLAFSPDGTYLASGGDDYALIIWNALQGSLLFRLVFKSAVDVVMWHPVRPDTILVGCANGSLQQIHDFSLLHSEQHEIHIGVRTAIYCLDYDAKSGRLAIGMGDEVHITRERAPNDYSGNMVLPSPQNPAHMDTLSDPRMRSVNMQFHDNGDSLIVSYLAHGIICWNTTTREQRWRIVLPQAKSIIGGSAISPDRRHIAVYNIVDGVDVYSLGSHKKAKPKKTYKLDAPARLKCGVKVSYVNRGHNIICGTTTGKICIWDAKTGEVVQHLPHNDDVVQAVSATIANKTSCIATSSANLGQRTYIRIWRAKIVHEGDGSSHEDTVASLVQAVARSDRLTRLGNFILAILVASAAIALFAGVCWALYHYPPWGTIWDIFTASFQQGLALSKILFAESISWLSVTAVRLYALGEYGASSAKERIRQTLRALLLSILPELADGARREFPGLQYPDDL